MYFVIKLHQSDFDSPVTEMNLSFHYCSFISAANNLIILLGSLSCDDISEYNYTAAAVIT